MPNRFFKEFKVITPKAKSILALMLLVSYPGYGQVLKNIGVTSGVNFTQLKWEYRYSGADPIENRRSEKQPIGFNIYLTADLLKKKGWGLNSSIGWILKRGMFTGELNDEISVPYNLHYLSWVNSVKGNIQLGKNFSLNMSLGPRIEYLLTGWDAIPVYAPNDDTFFYYHRKEDVQKFAVGITAGGGLAWQLKKTTLQLSAWKNVNFNPIISASGLRGDGLGDEDAYFKMTDNTYGINLQLSFPL